MKLQENSSVFSLIRKC